MEKVISISRETLVKNPKGGMTIAFRYADEDGNLDKFIRLGYICDWDEVYDEVGLFYMDIVLSTQSGEVVENSNELHCEFDPDRMSDIRLATEHEVRLLSESLISSRTQLMIEEQENAIAIIEVEEEKEQKWENYIKEIETISVKYGFDARDLWCYLNDKAREEGW